MLAAMGETAHDHGHGGHSHGVSADADRKLLTLALILIVGFMAAEVVVGVIAGSLATTVPGAYPGLPRREAIERLLSETPAQVNR